MAAQNRKRWKQLLPTVTLTAIPFTVFCPTAEAFFPPIVPPPAIVVPPLIPPPVITPPIVVPPLIPPPFVPPVVPPVIVPPVIPPPIVVPPICDCHSTPNCVPEPTTFITSLIGVIAAAGYGFTRRKNGQATQASPPDAAGQDE